MNPGLGLSIPVLSQKHFYLKKPRGHSLPYLLGTSLLQNCKRKMKEKNDSKHRLSNLHLIRFFKGKQPQTPLSHISAFIISVVGNTELLPSTGTREQRMCPTRIPTLACHLHTVCQCPLGTDPRSPRMRESLARLKGNIRYVHYS